MLPPTRFIEMWFVTPESPDSTTGAGDWLLPVTDDGRKANPTVTVSEYGAGKRICPQPLDPEARNPRPVRAVMP